MTYQETLDYMMAQLPMYQRVGQAALKPDLSNTRALMEVCGHPEKKLTCIHIAGTNGKGSTAHMLASVFQEAGYNTGLYTSPHLVDFRERIKINSNWISKDYIIDFVAQHKADFERIQPSFFEMTVALAFDYFVNQKTDIAIIETGLGGRLDSTNVVTPEASVITNIDFDHMHLLGNTLEAIATEKGGIIKPNVPVVCGDSKPEVISTLKAIAEKQKAKFIQIDANCKNLPESDLTADYQKSNIITALTAVDIINQQGQFSVSDESVKKGLKSVIANTRFAGRWQVINEKPRVIADVGHNKAGWEQIKYQLKKESYDKLHIVYGTVNDKAIDDIISMLPKDAHYYLCAANVPRALSEGDLCTIFEKYSIKNEKYKSCGLAYKSALNNCKSNDLILVAGSLFVVGEILAEKT